MTRSREPDYGAATARSIVRPADHRIRHALFYGTLCRREANHALLGLPDAVTFRGERRVPGALYDFGSYPGMILGAGPTIAELYRIDDPSVLRRLDRFERYDPRGVEHSLFKRVEIAVPRFAHSAATLRAWIYVFNGSVAGRRRIEAPSWYDYRRSGQPARAEAPPDST